MNKTCLSKLHVTCLGAKSCSDIALFSKNNDYKEQWDTDHAKVVIPQGQLV